MRSLPVAWPSWPPAHRRQAARRDRSRTEGDNWGGLLPRLFDAFLTVSAYSAHELGAPAARTRVIYGGADPQRYAPDPSVSASGVLFVGRLTPHKGIDRLLAALPSGTRLTVVGSDGHDPRLPERDYPRLDPILGALPRRALPRQRDRRRPARSVSIRGGVRAAVGDRTLLRAPHARLGAARPGGAGGDGQRHASHCQPDWRRPRGGRRRRAAGFWSTQRHAGAARAARAASGDPRWPAAWAARTRGWNESIHVGSVRARCLEVYDRRFRSLGRARRRGRAAAR